MKIDLSSIDREQFLVHEHIIAGETCYLVQPQHIGAKWNKDNLIYRSSVWNSQGEPVSLSWKKHFNWDEQPDIDPAPKSLDGVELMEKVDGSTLLVSRYKGQLIVRTRGTVDATKLDNGHEIALFKTKYPAVFSESWTSEHWTMVYEWVSPTNQIVIAYPEPALYLTGIIMHSSYRYLRQDSLDYQAHQMGVLRPRRYRFDTLSEMLTAVSAFNGVEGVCAYYNNNDSWRKQKSVIYLALHRFKERATLPNILELWMKANRPTIAVFRAQLLAIYDHECLTLVDGFITDISLAWDSLSNQLADLALDIEPLKNWARRDAALKIQTDYTEKGLTGAAFNFLSNRPVDERTVYKLMEKRLGL